jgi:hypothetical protein
MKNIQIHFFYNKEKHFIHFIATNVQQNGPMMDRPGFRVNYINADPLSNSFDSPKDHCISSFTRYIVFSYKYVKSVLILSYAVYVLWNFRNILFGINIQREIRPDYENAILCHTVQFSNWEEKAHHSMLIEIGSPSGWCNLVYCFILCMLRKILKIQYSQK